LKEEPKLVFENRLLRRIFRHKRDEVTGKWRKLHNKEFYDLYSSPNIWGDQIKKNEMGGARGMYGDRAGASRVLVGRMMESDQFNYQHLDGEIIWRWIVRR
jgi:hypothetical protein